MNKEQAGPCPRCMSVIGYIHQEMVQPLPPGALAPLGHDGQKCCYDCASADGLTRFVSGLDWKMARIAVGNDRQEQLRLPGVLLGLVALGLVRPSGPGDLEKHHAWMRTHGLLP